MKVAIYARYSSENQRDASITDQFRVCRELAADEELVTDRCVPLLFRRVPGVDGDFHSRSSSTERSDSATA